MDAAHPTYPHWYLRWSGVDSVLQGRGLGSELMEHCLEIVNTSHVPAYLETPNPRNLTFYGESWVRGDGRGASGEMPTDYVHAEGCAVILRRTFL
jgi:GNAT superfamily N-acetyltransferase